MKQLDDVVFVIYARLSSQRVPVKMLRPFAGTTLVDIALDKIKNSSIIPLDHFYLAVHEPELVEVGNRHGLQVFLRSAASAAAENSASCMLEWWNRLNYKWCICVNACSPFLSISTIDDFIISYLKSTARGMLAVILKRNYFWDDKGNLITTWPKNHTIMNTKAVAPLFECAQCLWAGEMQRIGDGIWPGSFAHAGDIDLYVIDNEYEALDIDYEWQFRMCETLYKYGVFR